VFLIAVGATQWRHVEQYIANPAQPHGLFTFGVGVAGQWIHFPRWLGLVAAPLGIAAAIAWWRKAPVWLSPTYDRRDYLFFILGAVLLTGCYLVVVNYAYRAVFAIMMAPFLWTAWTADNWPATYRRLGRIAGVLTLVLMWLDGLICLFLNLAYQIRPGAWDISNRAIMLGQQPLVALLIVALAGFLVPFLREALRSLRSPPLDAVRGSPT
jgi:hypothetical protein